MDCRRDPNGMLVMYPNTDRWYDRNGNKILPSPPSSSVDNESDIAPSSSVDNESDIKPIKVYKNYKDIKHFCYYCNSLTKPVYHFKGSSSKLRLWFPLDKKYTVCDKCFDERFTIKEELTKESRRFTKSVEVYLK
jgi:hypothetical protein